MLEVPGEERGDRVAMGAGGAEGDGRGRSAEVPGQMGMPCLLGCPGCREELPLLPKLLAEVG